MNIFGKNVPYQQTLKGLFPNCQTTKENLFLTKKQVKEIEKGIDKKLYSKMGLRYKVDCDGTIKYAYVDSHIVRTLNETVVVVVDENNVIESYDISTFMEPSEYIPPKKWINQVLKRKVSENFRLSYEIDALSGATLSAKATVDTAKKVLYLHQVLGQN